MRDRIMAENTVVENPEDGGRVTLLKGETVPAWAADQVGDHLVEGSAGAAKAARRAPAVAEQRYPTAKEIAAEVVALLREEMDAHADDDADQAPVDEAPKGNASREEWAAYAATKGAPEEETRPVDEGGLKHADLKDKYGK